jgi:hypothetical protein
VAEADQVHAVPFLPILATVTVHRAEFAQGEEVDGGPGAVNVGPVLEVLALPVRVLGSADLPKAKMSPGQMIMTLPMIRYHSQFAVLLYAVIALVR